MTDDGHKSSSSPAKVRSITASPKPQKVAAHEFMVPMSDAHGHAARIEFRCLPDFKRRISLTIGAVPETGWKTESDFCRWAIRYGLDAIEVMAQDTELTNVMLKCKMMDMILAREEMNARISASLEHMSGVVDKMPRAAAQRMISSMVEMAGEMDDDEWREIWLKELERKFGR